MRTATKILIPCCLLLALAAAGAAQQAPSAADVQAWMGTAGHGTPDGVPPSGETVCNGLIGDAHGLCTAYCEAMDCDSGAPQASQKACEKVRDNFIKHTGQNPPCDCPCVAQVPGFIDALNGQSGSLLQCNEGLFFLGSDVAIVSTSSGFTPIAAISFDGTQAACGNFPEFALLITPDQGRACINLIVQKATAAGLTCPPFFPPV
jgi:hypothetical protein